METLTTIESIETNGGFIVWDLDSLPYGCSCQGSVYADGTGSGYPGEVWFP